MARKQKLITKTLERTIPKLYATEDERDQWFRPGPLSKVRR